MPPADQARPGRLDLEAARDRTLPDVLPGPGTMLRVLEELGEWGAWQEHPGTESCPGTRAISGPPG
jgi:hypothetical protein